MFRNVLERDVEDGWTDHVNNGKVLVKEEGNTTYNVKKEGYLQRQVVEETT
jgi:hypothetical protein